MRRALPGILFLCTIAIAAGPAHAACTVCHSKNPKMVKMHEALEFKDCFRCHRPGVLKNGQAGREQMTYDQLCAQCHGKATEEVLPQKN